MPPANILLCDPEQRPYFIIMASSAQANPDVLVTLKVSFQGSNRRFKLPLRDVGATTLEDKVRHDMPVLSSPSSPPFSSTPPPISSRPVRKLPSSPAFGLVNCNGRLSVSCLVLITLPP